MLDRGATTLWEHWEFSDNTYSHNHPMFGSVSEWFFSWLAGIQPDPDAVGYDRIVFRPSPSAAWPGPGPSSAPPGAKSRARGGSRTPLRPVRDRPGQHDGGRLHSRPDPAAVREGGRPPLAAGVAFRRVDAGSCVFAVGSGRYESPPPRESR